MIYEGTRQELFEAEYILNDLVQKYYIIRNDFSASRRPPIPADIIARFRTDYRVELTEEEYSELKEYAETDYLYNIPDKLQYGIQSGEIQELKFKY